MKFFVVFQLFISSFLQVSAQKNVINDFSVSLHEETVNKVLTAVGDIHGTNNYEVMMIHGKYHWTIKNPRISIRPDSSFFNCDAIVNVGLIDYKTPVTGNVKIYYDELKDQISIKITRAVFELYTVFLGKKVHIKNIHLEDYFKDPFVFEGPRAMTTQMAFTLPDSTVKTIYVQPTICKMELKWKELSTACEVAASNAPFKPAIKVIAPIEAVKPVAQPSIQPQKK